MTAPHKQKETEEGAIAYRVYRNADVNALMRDVTAALNGGWHLAGGISVCTIDGFPFFAQAVVTLP